MKIRKLFNIAFAGTALAFAACTSEEEQFNLPENSQAIEIGTYIQQGTRAVEKTEFAEGDAFTLSATKTTGSYGNVFTPNFMEEMTVTNSAGAWSYSPLATWPINTTERLSFAAWYPGSAENVNGLTYTHTVNTTPADQVDLLWGTVKDAYAYDRNGTAINGNEADAAFEATSGNLNLKFAHALSKVQFKIKLASDYPGVTTTLKSFKLSNTYLDGICTIADDLAGIQWSNQQTTHTFSLLEEETALSATPQLMGEAMLLIPQYNPDMTIDIEYEYTLTDTENRTVTKSYPFVTAAWEANKSYVYTINLSLELATIDISTTVQDRSDDVTATCNTEHLGVDLGLPSGVKWATCNMGATTSTECGDYYAWGTLEARSPSDRSYPPYYDSSTMTWTDIGPDISGTQYDAARQVWGGEWRIPTIAECQELIDECVWTYVTINGMIGFQVTGKNGNKIFLPDAYRNIDGNLTGGGCYWTSQYYEDYIYSAASTLSWVNIGRENEQLPYVPQGTMCYASLTIRPVHD